MQQTKMLAVIFGCWGVGRGTIHIGHMYGVAQRGLYMGRGATSLSHHLTTYSVSQIAISEYFHK